MSSTERMILGNNCIYSGNPKETGLNRNVLIVGGTGSGKTVLYLFFRYETEDILKFLYSIPVLQR